MKGFDVGGLREEPVTGCRTMALYLKILRCVSVAAADEMGLMVLISAALATNIHKQRPIYVARGDSSSRT